MSISKCGGIPGGFGFIQMASYSPISLQIATFGGGWSQRRPAVRNKSWSIRYVGKRNGWDGTRCYRRAVTRRASRIFAPEPAFRKQDAAKSGQTCVEQFEAEARTSSRSPLASTATSSVCTLGANPGKAITDAPRSASTARADSDLTIWGCWLFHLRSLHFWGSAIQQPKRE